MSDYTLNRILSEVTDLHKRLDDIEAALVDLSKKEEPKTKFTYDDYLKLTPNEREKIGNKEWHDLTPEERMLILEDWGFGDDIKDYKKVIRDKKDMDALTKKEDWSVYDYQRFEELI